MTKSNFLLDYQIYASGNESPPDYHFWCGLSALSACCGPRLWVDMGKFNINPNLYVVLVGRPGIRKTTAMNIAEKVCRKISTKDQHIPIAPVGMTKEHMLKWMSEEKSPCKKVFKWDDKPRHYTQVSIFASELAQLLETGGDPIAYVTVLTNIYDPQPSFDTATIARGVQVIPYPYITLVGCMTPEITGNLIRENALSGGFSRRCLFVYADRNAPAQPFPVETPEQKAALDRLIQRGREVQTLQGTFTFDQGGYDAYVKWYHENHAEAERTTSAAVQNFLQTKPSLAIKVAMLATIAETDELIITAEKINFGIEAVTLAQHHIDSVFAGVGRNPHAATLGGIKTYVEGACNKAPHWVPIKKIQGAFLQHASAKEIVDLITQMASTEPPQIRIVEITMGSGQRVKAVCSNEFFDKVSKSLNETPAAVALKLPPH
jgi:hypothetical protein